MEVVLNGKQKIGNVKKWFLKKTVQAGNVLHDQKGEGYVDSAIRIIIGLVLGALILAAFYLLFNKTVLPTVGTKISGLFNYSGN